VAAVIRVHHLQRAQPGPVQLDGRHQVRRRLLDPDDLDQRTAGQRDLLAGPGRRRVYDVLRDVVKQFRRRVYPHTGHDQLGLAVRGEPHRVGPGWVDPVALDPLHGPAAVLD
jgi:hypothetical protein